MRSIYLPSQEGALRQCEIVTNLVQLRLVLATLETEGKSMVPINHPYAIVLSQDCDLDNDWRSRSTVPLLDESEEGKKSRSQNLLPAVMFAEVITAETLRIKVPKGSHFWATIRQNKNERYQFLQEIGGQCDALGLGLPELGVDFKRYFSLPTDELYKRLEIGELKRRCRLDSPYSQHFSSRFSYYQARVALPEQHFSEAER